MMIDVQLMSYQELNKKIKESGDKEIILMDVHGQRYIACGLDRETTIKINGIPGNDLGAYMNHVHIEVMGNLQDAAGNTMSGGKIIAHGRAGDAMGYAMRNGEIYVRDDVGYRCGIHMKEYENMIPVIVIGGSAGSFLGEYMAGGRIILLALDGSKEPIGSYCATGLHGGAIYIRGEVDEKKISKEVKVVECHEEDIDFISNYVNNFCSYFNEDYDRIMKSHFNKLVPKSNRPYGKMYTGI